MSVPRVLNGRYEVGALLGRGGMADVYSATDTLLGRVVAIKVLRGDVGRDSQLQARFRREAQAVAGLNHPSIVAVYDTGEHASTDALQDGSALPYIVMEYVHGKTLRDLVRAKDVTIDRAIDYTLGVLSALEYSHRSGIVHRDIKPANVMVTEGHDGQLGAVKVMDFGIARTISDSAATMTQTQTVMGTAQYLSPEQARGETVDARSDLYSAACMFYELLAGRPPFTGESPVSVAYQHVRELPSPPSKFNPEVSPALDALLLRALQKARQDRFQDAASFRRALRAARSGVALPPVPQPLVSAPITPPAPPPARYATPVADIEPSPDNPSTRAMARVLTGGPLTTHDAGAIVEEPLPLELTVKRRRRAWIVTLFVFLAIMLGGGGVLAYNLATAEPPPPPQISIPSVVGLTETAAIAKLEILGLDTSSTTEFSKTVESGLVIRTNPTASTMVDERSSVALVVSKGSSEATIPADLTGRTDAEVRDILTTLNLKVTPNKRVNNAEIQAGLVVTSDPLPGTTVPVGTAVTLMISTGQVAMPDLLQLTDDPAQVRAAVQATLTQVSPHFKVDFVEVENTAVTPGMVTGQSVAAGTAVAPDADITVTLAKAPEPEPVPTPTAEPTPTPAVPEPSATLPVATAL